MRRLLAALLAVTVLGPAPRCAFAQDTGLSPPRVLSPRDAAPQPGGSSAPQGKGTAANPQAQGRSTLDAVDLEFFKEAGLSAQIERDASALAATHGASAAVRTFATSTLGSARRMRAQLQALAKKKNVDLPGDLDSRGKDTIGRLNASVGADFDQAYAQAMQSNLHDAISLYQTTARDSKDSEVMRFAAHELPMLKRQQTQAAALPGSDARK